MAQHLVPLLLLLPRNLYVAFQVHQHVQGISPIAALGHDGLGWYFVVGYLSHRCVSVEAAVLVLAVVLHGRGERSPVVVPSLSSISVGLLD